jgi:agmatinase
MWSKNIVNFIGCDCGYEEADVVLYGAPFDSTTSFRPGARFGSQAVRAESFGLETYSPYQEKDLTDGKVCDSGDPELPMGSTEESLRMIGERCRTILEDGKLPFLIGGEHLVTLGAVREVRKKYPDLAIIHLDAHADLREDYLGVKLSHACVMRRCWELTGDGSIWQLGIRSGDREEFRWAEEGHVKMSPFSLQDARAAAEAFRGRPVYLTLDLDVLDPSVFPGTGTPEAGGAGFTELLLALLEICRNSRIVGCDVVELSPHYDPSGVSTAVAGKIIRELLIALMK